MSGKHQSFFKEAGINKCHKNVLYVSVNIFSFFFYLPCVVTVTLLDSMSALADLGWEAYPNEGVSTCSVQHTHTHIDIYDLAQNKI